MRPAATIGEQPEAGRGEHKNTERVTPGHGAGATDRRFQADWPQAPKMSIEERRDLGVWQDPALLE